MAFFSIFCHSILNKLQKSEKKTKIFPKREKISRYLLHFRKVGAILSLGKKENPRRTKKTVAPFSSVRPIFLSFARLS